MFPQVRIADRFRLQSAEQLVVTGGTIIQGLTDNTAFPSPTVDLKTVQSAIDDLSAALAAQMHGGMAATAEKNIKRAALVAHLRKLKHYVEDHCGNDPAILMSSGFQPAARNRTRTPLATPSIFDISLGNRGELLLRVTPIVHARCYEVRMAALGADNAPGAWQSAGLFTSTRSLNISGLVSGTTYTFQVRGIGGSTGYSDWSNPASCMCT